MVDVEQKRKSVLLARHGSGAQRRNSLRDGTVVPALVLPERRCLWCRLPHRLRLLLRLLLRLRLLLLLLVARRLALGGRLRRRELAVLGGDLLGRRALGRTGGSLRGRALAHRGVHLLLLLLMLMVLLLLMLLLLLLHALHHLLLLLRRHAAGLVHRESRHATRYHIVVRGEILLANGRGKDLSVLGPGELLLLKVGHWRGDVSMEDKQGRIVLEYDYAVCRSGRVVDRAGKVI